MTTITAPCACGAADVAASRERENQTLVRRWGPLDELHGVHFDEQETEPGGTREGDFDVFCHPCLDAADAFDAFDAFDAEAGDPETAEGSDEFRVECGGCGREIEFGWSLPDRGGRIWPVESADFTPWKSWPEPRYREAWKQRGWLRPGTE